MSPPSAGTAVDPLPPGGPSPAAGLQTGPGVLPGGEEWVIAAAGHEVTVVRVGGGVRSYTFDGVDVVDGYPADQLPPGCRGQVLAPWANRIRDGRYPFGGSEHQLDIGEVATNTAFHGLVRWQAWDAVLHETDSLVLSTVVPARDGYPFTLRLGLRYSVGSEGLTVEHTATNIGRSAAPFMMAMHCYPTVAGSRVDELRLTVPAGTYVPTDDRLLPLPVQDVADSRFDLSRGEVFGDRVLDNAFGSLERDSDGMARVLVEAPDGRAVQMWADQSFGWLQVYSSDTQTDERFRRSFAIEPMTGPPDCFRSGVDLVVLQPGGVWRGRWGLAVLAGGGGPATTGARASAAGRDGVGATVTGPPVTGTAADLLPDVTTDEAEIRRAEQSRSGSADSDDDERILREVPPHHLG